MATEVDRHVQRFLGPPRTSYVEDFGTHGTIEISLYPDQPWEGAVTLVSSGLAAHGGIGQELLFSVWERQLDEGVLALFSALLLHRLQRHAPLAAGEVLPPAGPIVDGSPLEAFYVTQPTYFPEELGAVRLDGSMLRLRWMIPLYPQEAGWIARHGDDPWEDLLVAQDPDLLDLHRPPVRLP